MATSAVGYSTGGNSTTGNENTSSNTETTTDQEAKPAETNPEPQNTIGKSENASLRDGGMYLNRPQDNTDINSVCKFNFIFYFIYKVKYDEAPTGTEHLDYEF